MPLQFNGVDIGALQYNGQEVAVLLLNGVEVWSSGPVVKFQPNNYQPFSGAALDIVMKASGETHISDSADGAEVFGTWLSNALTVGKTYNVTFRNTSVDNCSITVEGTGFPKATIPSGQVFTIPFTPASGVSYMQVRPVGDITGKSAVFTVSLDGAAPDEFAFHA